MPRSRHAQPEPHDPAIEDVLGPLGAAVMRAVWAQGESSVSERGLLEREKQGRPYV